MKMTEIIKRFISPYRRKDREFDARLGNLSTGIVSVPDTDHTVYVTLAQDGTILEAINNRVPNIVGYPVRVGYEPGNPSRLIVLRAAPVFGDDETDADGLQTHGPTHSWANGDKPGIDPVYVWGEQILPMLYYPSGLTVKIYPGAYRTSTGWATKRQRSTVDLSSHVPGTVGKARYALIVVNVSGNFAVRDGALVTGYGNLTDADIPEPTEGDSVICAVKLFYGQTSIRLTPGVNDFVDLRWAGANNGSTAAVKPHGSTHISTGDDPVPDAVSGGASGLMSGTDKAKIDNYDDWPRYLITEDLTEQIDGVTAHFDTLAPMETWPIVTCNLRQLPADNVIDDDGLGFTLSYVPEVGDKMTVDYLVSGLYVMRDGDGNILYDANGNIILEV